jgi:hypothetical protein
LLPSQDACVSLLLLPLLLVCFVLSLGVDRDITVVQLKYYSKPDNVVQQIPMPAHEDHPSLDSSQAQHWQSPLATMQTRAQTGCNTQRKLSTFTFCSSAVEAAADNAHVLLSKVDSPHRHSAGAWLNAPTHTNSGLQLMSYSS